MVAGTALAAFGYMLTTVQTLAVPLSAALESGWIAALEVLRQLGFVAAVLALVAVGAELLPLPRRADPRRRGTARP